MSAASTAFETYGLLEKILSFTSETELLSVAFVSKRWKEAARCDSFWLRKCRPLWKDKWGMSHITGDEDSEVRKDCFQTTRIRGLIKMRKSRVSHSVLLVVAPVVLALTDCR